MRTTLTSTSTACPFAERFGRALPADLAAEAGGLHWRELVERYAPSTDTVHLADLTRLPLGRGRTRFEATLSRPGADGPHTRRLSVDASGEFSAMTEMLAQLGTPVETERVHHAEAGGTWCAILRGTDGRNTVWALGFGATSGEAGAHALLGAAGRLHLGR